MKGNIDFELYKSIQEEAFDWTFLLVDVLHKITKPNGKIRNLQDAVMILKSEKDNLNEVKIQLLQKIEQLEYKRRTIGTFLISLKKLLDCSVIDYSNSMIISAQPFDVFEKVDSPDINEEELYEYVLHINSKIEEAFVAFNQSYARMLIKEKLMSHIS